MTLQKRIADRLGAVGITPAQLAREVGIKAPSVSAWMSGHTKTIKGENLLRAARALQCSAEWLATGKGNPELSDATKAASMVREESPAYITDPTIEEAIAHLRSLDPPGRREALQWLRGFAAGKKTESNAPHRHHSSLAAKAAVR